MANQLAASVLRRFIEQNQLLGVHREAVLRLFEEVNKCKNEGAQLASWFNSLRRKHIGEWTTEDVTTFVRSISANDACEPRYLPELVAVVDHAMYLASIQTSPTKPIRPHCTQILALLASLSHELIDADGSRSRGRLLQMATGEGKSIVVAMLAAILAIRHKYADVVTSSALLAERDATSELFKQFYGSLGLIVAHNTNETGKKGTRECYTANIVYGDLDSFQGDWLRHEFKLYKTRGERPRSAAIIDEIDSMLIDDNLHERILMLSFPVPGMEYLEQVKLMHGKSSLCWQQVLLTIASG